MPVTSNRLEHSGRKEFEKRWERRVRGKGLERGWV